jgi:6-pyruvoyltetrahydropterin/6-carboxytetrahydropterin synthase
MVNFADVNSTNMASVIRVTKEFPFEMAHALYEYDGPCRNVHGHSYKLFVTISGVPIMQPGNPKLGMVMDFTDLKTIVKSEVVDRFDHAVVVSSSYGEEKTGMFRKLFGNTVVVDYQPTCENLVADFASRIATKLPTGVKLFSLRLFETATSYAEWFAEDNR